MLVTDDGLELCVDRFAKELSLALVIGAADPFYRHPEIVATFCSNNAEKDYRKATLPKDINRRPV
jgi:hypothetical protein